MKGQNEGNGIFCELFQQKVKKTAIKVKKK